MVDEVYCIVHGCPNSRQGKEELSLTKPKPPRRKSSSVQYYRFPIDNLDLLDKWLRALFEKNNAPNHQEIIDKSRICAMHFTTEDFTTNDEEQQSAATAAAVTSSQQDSSSSSTGGGSRQKQQLNSNAVPSVFTYKQSQSQRRFDEDDDDEEEEDEEDEDEDELKSGSLSSSSSSSSSRSQTSSPSSLPLKPPQSSSRVNNGDCTSEVTTNTVRLLYIFMFLNKAFSLILILLKFKYFNSKL